MLVETEAGLGIREAWSLKNIGTGLRITCPTCEEKLLFVSQSQLVLGP